MHLTMLLEMAADGFGDRVAFGRRAGGLTYAGLLERARRAAAYVADRGIERVVFVDVNSDAVPVLLFGSAGAGVPFVPLNYRQPDRELRRILERTAPCLAVASEDVPARVGPVEGVVFVAREMLVADSGDAAAVPASGDVSPEAIAVLLFTSGTTGEPKAAVLRHKHLASYVISTVEFMGAGEEEAALVSVPPYHIAGTSAVLTSVFAGRRLVYLPTFTADAWVDAARDEAVTHAMVVPTMLGRILDVLVRDGERLPHLRHLAYGGGRMPLAVIERALEMLPEVEFVNAYGLTETSSTIAVLGPSDHRHAAASPDPSGRRRLGSVGTPLPTVDVEIRDGDGRPLVAGEVGEIWVRGEQVAGEYLDRGTAVEDGWFPTRDSGWLDDEGYLFLEGRLDDVIVRGAENVSPGEVEDVLVAHPGVADAGVVGVPDTEWGEKVVAAVVLAADAAPSEAELQSWVRERLRSTKTPQHIAFVQELPYGETGKLLRRVLKADLVDRFADVVS